MTPSEGPVVNDNNNNNVVAIAVGATIGSILVLVTILVIVGVFVICIRRSQSKGSYEPGGMCTIMFVVANELSLYNVYL